MLWPSSELGVPERRAHSEPSGPAGSHASRKIANAAGAGERRAAPGGSGGPAAQHAAEHGRHDASAHSTLSISSQLLLTSLPVPRPCTSASGQLA